MSTSFYPHSASLRLTPVADWPRLPPEMRLYKASMIEPDSRGFIYVTHRGADPVLRLNPDGSLNRVVGADLLTKSAYYYRARPEAEAQYIEDAFCLHGLHVDPWDNVWVTDFGRNLVMRFDPAGRLTFTMGVDGEAGCDATHFNQPTHAVVTSAGEIFVADGYVNSRIVKFDRRGKFIREWGRRGTEPGQFHTPHVLALTPDGRLIVSDRENNRIQIFDLDGALLEVWSNLRCVDGLSLAPDGRLWGSSGPEHALLQFGPRGALAQVWSDPARGPFPSRQVGAFPDCDYAHGLWAAGDGALYVAETNLHPDGCRILKFQVGG